MNTKTDLFLNVIDMLKIKRDLDSIILKKEFDSLSCTFDSIELIETEKSDYELPTTELFVNLYIVAYKKDKLIVDRMFKFDLLTNPENMLEEIEWLGFLNDFTVKEFTDDQKVLLLEGIEFEQAFIDDLNIKVQQSPKKIKQVYKNKVTN